jgi:hypothetical protein
MTLRQVFTAGLILLVLAVGYGIGFATHTTTQTVSHTVTRTVTVPGPERTVIKDVPGPTVTKIKTVTVPAPPPAAGQQVGSWSGTGNQVTPAFNVPSSGNFIVKWTYSNNTQDGMATNFSFSDTANSFSGNTPNDIASSGEGSTEFTQVTATTDAFNVQAAGDWTITVTAA